MMMDLYALNFCMENKIFIKLMAFWLLQKMIVGSILLKIFNSTNNVYNQRVKVWLGGPTKNTLKGQSRNKNWPNNVLGPFSLNVFIIIIYFFSCLFITCQSIWLEFFITTKRWKLLQICIPYTCGPFRNQVFKLWKFITKLHF